MYVDRIFPIDLEKKDPTDTTTRFASHIDLHLEIDNEGQLRTKLYNKKYYFNIPIVSFPFICSNITYHLHMESLSLSWSDIPKRVVPILIEGS